MYMGKPGPCEMAAFEAGIKLGALYHQFTGVPVSEKTAESLEEAMEEAISNQPYVSKVRVFISREKLAARENVFGYAELSGDMVEAEVEVECCGARAAAKLGLNEATGYPLMELVWISC